MPKMTAMHQAYWPHDIIIENQPQNGLPIASGSPMLRPDTVSHFMDKISIISSYYTAPRAGETRWTGPRGEPGGPVLEESRGDRISRLGSTEENVTGESNLQSPASYASRIQEDDDAQNGEGTKLGRNNNNEVRKEQRRNKVYDDRNAKKVNLIVGDMV